MTQERQPTNNNFNNSNNDKLSQAIKKDAGKFVKNHKNNNNLRIALIFGSAGSMSENCHKQQYPTWLGENCLIINIDPHNFFCSTQELQDKDRIRISKNVKFMNARVDFDHNAKNIDPMSILLMKLRKNFQEIFIVNHTDPTVMPAIYNWILEAKLNSELNNSLFLVSGYASHLALWFVPNLKKSNMLMKYALMVHSQQGGRSELKKLKKELIIFEDIATLEEHCKINGSIDNRITELQSRELITSQTNMKLPLARIDQKALDSIVINHTIGLWINNLPESFHANH